MRGDEVQKCGSRRGREALFQKKKENIACGFKIHKKGGPGAGMAPKKERMKGAVDEMTAMMHRNIFVVGPSDGKRAQVTDENAIIDLALERKKAKRARKRSDENGKSDQHGPFWLHLRVRKVVF